MMTFLRKKGEKTRPPVRIQDIDFHAPENRHFFMTREQKEKEKKNSERHPKQQGAFLVHNFKKEGIDYAK